MWIHVRFLYSLLAQIFLQIVVLERECKNLGFKKIMKIVSQTSFEIVARTHARVLNSYPRLMFGHFVEVRLNMNLENIVELGSLKFFEIVARPNEWLLYSFLTQIFSSNGCNRKGL